MTSCTRIAAAALIAILVAPIAVAREDISTFAVKYARENVDQSRVLENISWHMAGEKHRGVAQSYDVATTNKTTNAAFKSDEVACARAFMSGIIQLQTRARNLGADGVIDIKSHVGGKTYDGPDIFGCTAGNIIARVSLTGTPVKFK